MANDRKLRGSRNYHAGRVAEESVARFYCQRGARVEDERWRGQGGEIDLVVTEGDEVVFVEVKSAANFAAAAQSLGSRQMRRICDAASEYVSRLSTGLLTPMRFDLALVDGMGRVEILEGAFGEPG